ncbi:MAG: hypothetical protein JST32_09195 [Bacteroidetes bacterium]|nr:hypothetical protein [Bacteroidota bacterium]
MKSLDKIFTVSLIFMLVMSAYKGVAQNAAKASVAIAINYFEANNSIPHLVVTAKSRVNGRFQPVGGITLKLCLDKDSTGTAIATVVTNKKGEATAYIPPSVKNEWERSKTHTFLAIFDGDKKYESANADLTVARAKMLISTSGKSITATVLQLKDTSWIPVKGVDVKIGVRRLGGDLPVNETPTFTTDSTGQASADFKRDNIPGDSKGNIVLVARVDDNDQFGNLSIETTVPWGAKTRFISDFDKRALFATRAKAPVWLIFMSGGIIVAVWATLILLVRNIFRIKKIGREAEPAVVSDHRI